MLSFKDPEHFWVCLGKMGFSAYSWDHENKNRYFLFARTMVIEQFPKGWDNITISELTGYRRAGTKMKILVGQYLNLEAWEEFKAAVEEIKGTSGIKSVGMNFNLKPRGKGGCLSSFHLIKEGNNYTFYVHFKIAEFPKKIFADLRMISYLITALDLPPKEYKVVFMFSALSWLVLTFNTFIPIFGHKNYPYKEFPVLEAGGFRLGTRNKIKDALLEFKKKFPKEYQEGCSLEFLIKQRTVCKKDQIDQLTS